LAPSLPFFPVPVRTLAILLLAWKMRKILFFRKCCQTKSFHLKTVNFHPKNPTRMLYQQLLTPDLYPNVWINN
jgi:hypothetical protein